MGDKKKVESLDEAERKKSVRKRNFTKEIVSKTAAAGRSTRPTDTPGQREKKVLS